MCFATAYTTPSCAPALSAEEYLQQRPWSAALGLQVTNSEDEVYFSLEYTPAAYESWEFCAGSAKPSLLRHWSAAQCLCGTHGQPPSNLQPPVACHKGQRKRSMQHHYAWARTGHNVFDMHTQWKTEQQGGGIYKYIYICVLRVVCVCVHIHCIQIQRILHTHIHLLVHIHVHLQITNTVPFTYTYLLISMYMSIHKYTCIDTCTHTNTYLSTKHLYKYNFTTNLHIIYIYIYIYILPESLPSHKHDKMLFFVEQNHSFSRTDYGLLCFAFRYLDDFRQTLPAFSGQKQCRLANDMFGKSNCGTSRWSAVIFGCIVTVAQNTSMIPLWINLPRITEGMKMQTAVPVNKIGLELLNAQKVKLQRGNYGMHGKSERNPWKFKL